MGARQVRVVFCSQTLSSLDSSRIERLEECTAADIRYGHQGNAEAPENLPRLRGSRSQQIRKALSLGHLKAPQSVPDRYEDQRGEALLGSTEACATSHRAVGLTVRGGFRLVDRSGVWNPDSA